MIPSIGRIVHYTLGENDVEVINQRRADYAQAAFTERRTAARTSGNQAHIGNQVTVGEVFPAMIVRVWGDDDTALVNLQVFLDGNDTLWATSRRQGENEKEWREPPRV